MLTTLLHGLEEEEGTQLTAAVAMIYKSKKESSALNFLPCKHKMGLDHHPANKTETQKNRFTYISERPDEANFLI
jgi:hypothetical protein